MQIFLSGFQTSENFLVTTLYIVLVYWIIPFLPLRNIMFIITQVKKIFINLSQHNLKEKGGR